MQKYPNNVRPGSGLIPPGVIAPHCGYRQPEKPEDTTHDLEAVSRARFFLATGSDVKEARDLLCAEYPVGYRRACRLVMRAEASKPDYTAAAIEFAKQSPDMPEKDLTNLLRKTFPEIGRNACVGLIKRLRERELQETK